MSRLLHKAVMIEAEGVFNSKNEWRGPVKARLQIEEPEWVKQKKEKIRNREDNEETVIIETLKKKTKLLPCVWKKMYFLLNQD